MEEKKEQWQHDEPAEVREIRQHDEPVEVQENRQHDEPVEVQEIWQHEDAALKTSMQFLRKNCCRFLALPKRQWG